MSNKKVNFPLWKKYELVQQYNCSTTKNVSKLAKEMDVPRTTLVSILKNEEQIISDFTAGRNIDLKRKRKHNFEIVDEPLLNWYQYADAENLPVSGKVLLSKAREFAHVCGCKDVERLDINWINRWKSRENISCKKLKDERDDTSSEVTSSTVPTPLDALTAIKQVEYYLKSEGESKELLHMLTKIEMFVLNKATAFYS